MRDSAFQYWRNERDAVEQEMDRLITAGSPASVEERQVRRIRFAALIERREAAACNLLRSDRALRGHKSSVARSRAGDWPSSVDYLPLTLLPSIRTLLPSLLTPLRSLSSLELHPRFPLRLLRFTLTLVPSRPTD
jgi:hypothetical protein